MLKNKKSPWPQNAKRILVERSDFGFSLLLPLLFEDVGLIDDEICWKMSVGVNPCKNKC